MPCVHWIAMSLAADLVLCLWGPQTGLCMLQNRLMTAVQVSGSAGDKRCVVQSRVFQPAFFSSTVSGTLSSSLHVSHAQCEACCELGSLHCTELSYFDAQVTQTLAMLPLQCRLGLTFMTSVQTCQISLPQSKRSKSQKRSRKSWQGGHSDNNSQMLH